MTNPHRPNVVPICDAVDRSLADELNRWTIDVSDEMRMALARAVTKRLQQGGMLNFDRPWEANDRFADVLAEAGLGPRGGKTQ